MQPLLDGDIILYEAGFGAETSWEGEDSPPFDWAAEKLDKTIANICAMVDATQPPILFLTGKTNFRYHIAKRTPYKARPGNKPFHYYNLKAYLKGIYDWRMVEGLEADDLMAIEQTSRPGETIICTRDKDLRQVPGMHYGWELAKQPSFGPENVTELGRIELSADRKKIVGTGSLFFFTQVLLGDRVDSIPGLDGCGPVKAFEILDGCQTSSDALKRVYGAYKKKYGIIGYREMLEQARLVYMIRKLREDGSPILWGQTK